MSVPCPDFARRMALKAGMPDEDIDELWETHVGLCDKDRSDYGGRRWTGLVESHVAKPRIQTVDRDDPVIAAARRAEREAKALEDAEYAKTAISLPEWLADLRVKPDFSEELTPVEAHIVRYREPYPGEDSAAWLMAALADYRGPIAECHKRRRRM